MLTDPASKYRYPILVAIPEREPTTPSTGLEELPKWVLATPSETTETTWEATLGASKWVATLGARVVWIVAVVEALAKLCRVN